MELRALLKNVKEFRYVSQSWMIDTLSAGKMKSAAIEILDVHG
jgi:hypothetical protein